MRRPAVHSGRLPQYSSSKADIALTFVHDVWRPLPAGRGSHHEAHDLCILVNLRYQIFATNCALCRAMLPSKGFVGRNSHARNVRFTSRACAWARLLDPVWAELRIGDRSRALKNAGWRTRPCAFETVPLTAACIEQSNSTL
jgi:hypothetical protein